MDKISIHSLKLSQNQNQGTAFWTTLYITRIVCFIRTVNTLRTESASAVCISAVYKRYKQAASSTIGLLATAALLYGYVYP